MGADAAVTMFWSMIIGGFALIIIGTVLAARLK